MTLPGDREAAPLGAAAALGYAFLWKFGGQPVTTRAFQVVAVTAVAVLIGVLPHVIAGRPPRIDVIARRLIVVAVPATLFRNGFSRHALESWQPWQLALAMVLLAVVAALVNVTLATAVRVGATRAPYVRAFRDELGAQAGIGAAVGATGVLIALSTGIMGYWALPVFCVPLLLTQYSFKRYATIRATYRQTIRSLARVTDVGGYTPNGHARRVCDMSLAVGRELGLSEAELLDLEYAALMHDIGQLSLVDPSRAVRRRSRHRTTSAGSRRRVPRSSGRPACSTGSPTSWRARPTLPSAGGGHRPDAPAGEPDHPCCQRLRRPGRRCARQRSAVLRARTAPARDGLRLRPARGRDAVAHRQRSTPLGV